MRVFIAGADGQLGSALRGRLGPRVAWAGGRGELDVRDAQAVARLLRETRPDAVINASAYNKVDAAESDPAEALAVNALGPRNLARSCHEIGAVLVHVSSDYVFDGRQQRPYREDDSPRPLSVYGVSKLAGEHMVSASLAPHILVRTSGVFGVPGSRGKGGSFVERILERARSGAALRVVADQVFSPTHAADLAAALVALLDTGARGLFHVTNAGSCTWHAFAEAALAGAGVRASVEPVRAADLGAPAARPAYSVLANDRYLALGLPPLRPWQEALRESLGA